MISTVLLVILSVYATWGFIIANRYSSKNNLLIEIILYSMFFIIEVILFTIFSYWYYKKINVYIKEEMDEQLKSQSELFANIAHDLKSPMTTIVGLARALEEQIIDKKEQVQVIGIIVEKSRHIDKIINLIFQYAKMDRDSYKLNIEEVDITRLLKKFIAQKYNEFEDKDMDLELNIPSHKVVALVDELEILRLIDNIVFNSIIHNPEKTKIQIGLRESENKIKIWVADSGNEIGKELENEIFKPFVSGEKSRNMKNGNGLGLAIAKKIAKMHNGDIFIEKCNDPYTKSFVVEFSKNNFS